MPVRFAYSMVWKATDAGSWPSCWGRTIAAPPRSAHVASWSTAAARNVSAAPTTTGAPVALQELRELADGRRLADAVHADDEHDGGALGQPEGRVELREVLLERLLQHPLQVARIGRAIPVDLLVQLVDDPLGDVGTEVRGEQRGLEVLPGRLVDGGLDEHAAQRATERPGAFSHGDQPRRAAPGAIAA